MKLPETWYRLFEARVSERMEPIRLEYENERNRNAGLDHNQKLSRDAQAIIDFTLKLFDLEVRTLIETYREWGKGYPDDQDYTDFGKRLDSIAQTYIGRFDQSHTNVFSQTNEFFLKGHLESVEREIKTNVGRVLSPLYTFILEGKAKAEDDKAKSTGKSSSESPIYMRFNPTAAEKVWLEAVYDKLRRNEEINPTHMLVELWEKLPKNFNYKDIDPRLIFFGVDITLLGILQIDPDTDLVSKTDRVIQCIKQAIKEDSKIASVNSIDIASSTGLSKHEVSIIFGLLQHLGNFWNGGASDNTGYRQVNIGHQSTLKEYLSYKNIDELLLKLYQRKDLRQIHASDDEQLETFPLIPSKITRNVFHQYEINDICSEEDFQDLVQLMFEYPDRSFYLYQEIDGDRNEILLAKEKLGEIVFLETEYFHYKLEEENFIHIEARNGNYANYREREIVEKGPMYIRTTMQISNRKRMEMETWLKIELEELYRKEYHKRMNTYDVFISYASVNTSEAHKLYEAVQQAGGRAFLSAKGINPGEDFADKIRDALAGSAELWLLASPNSLQSDWVVSEWGAAWALKKPIIPILHRCSVEDLPDRLQRLQVIDFYRHQELIDAKKGGWVAI